MRPTRLPHLVAPASYCFGSFKCRHSSPASSISSTLTSVSSFHPNDHILCSLLRPRHPRPFRPSDAHEELLIYIHLSCFFFVLHLLWPSTSPNEHHRAAVSCILSTHLPSHVRLHASLGSFPSTYASDVSNNELQYNIRRFSYAPKGPHSVLHGRRPED